LNGCVGKKKERKDEKERGGMGTLVLRRASSPMRKRESEKRNYAGHILLLAGLKGRERKKSKGKRGGSTPSLSPCATHEKKKGKGERNGRRRTFISIFRRVEVEGKKGRKVGAGPKEKKGQRTGTVYMNAFIHFAVCSW